LGRPGQVPLAGDAPEVEKVVKVELREVHTILFKRTIFDF
jgi:hypothetical protein